MKRDLKAIRGHAEMAVTFQEKGLAAMLTSLGSLLPPLITPGLLRLLGSLCKSCLMLATTELPHKSRNLQGKHCAGGVNARLSDLSELLE